MRRLTGTERSGLESVALNQVRHFYTGKGNVYRCNGMASLTFHRLERRGLIEDGPGVGSFMRTCPVVLTAKGRSALAQSEEKK